MADGPAGKIGTGMARQATAPPAGSFAAGATDPGARAEIAFAAVDGKYVIAHRTRLPWGGSMASRGNANRAKPSRVVLWLTQQGARPMPLATRQPFHPRTYPWRTVLPGSAGPATQAPLDAKAPPYRPRHGKGPGRVPGAFPVASNSFQSWPAFCLVIMNTS